MRKSVLIFLILFSLLTCKNDKKSEDTLIQQSTNDLNNKSITNTFEDNLIDLRDINQQFTIDYQIEKFGIKKVNDSIYELVFKLKNSTTPETIKKYSVGVKAFDMYLEKPLMFSRSPDLELIENNKYIFIRNNFKKTKYLDSIEAYIYARNNWKASGRLGTIKVKDILFEEKNK